MIEFILQNYCCIMWYFILGFVLSVVIIGVVLWGGVIFVVVGVGFSVLILVILLGMVIGNIVYL